MHPVDDFLAVFLVHAQHFAQRIERQLVGEEFDEIQLRPVRLQIIEQRLDFHADLLTQLFDIGWNEEVFLLDPHLHVARLVHRNQIVHRRADQDFGPPMLTRWHGHIDTAPLGRKDCRVQLDCLDVFISRNRPESAAAPAHFRPHDRSLAAHSRIQVMRVAPRPGIGIPKLEVGFQHGICAGVYRHVRAGIFQDVIADEMSHYKLRKAVTEVDAVARQGKRQGVTESFSLRSPYDIQGENRHPSLLALNAFPQGHPRFQRKSMIGFVHMIRRKDRTGRKTWPMIRAHRACHNPCWK